MTVTEGEPPEELQPCIRTQNSKEMPPDTVILDPPGAVMLQKIRTARSRLYLSWFCKCIYYPDSQRATCFAFECITLIIRYINKLWFFTLGVTSVDFFRTSNFSHICFVVCPWWTFVGVSRDHNVQNFCTILCYTTCLRKFSNFSEEFVGEWPTNWN